MAHARRKFADIVKITKTNGLAQEAIKFFKSLYKIEKEAQEKNLSPKERYNLRQQKSITILESFKSWLDNHLTITSPRGSPEGAKAGAIFYSLIETCKANNIEPFKYFCTIFHCIRDCQTDEDYKKLLPQNIQFNIAPAV